MRSFFKSRHILGMGFIVLGACFLYQTYYNDILFASGALEPMDYPRALIIIWLFLSLLYIFIPRRGMEAEGVKKAAPLLVKVTVAAVVHIWLLNYLGFICSTFIFLMCFFYLFKDRRFLRMAVISSVSALSLWFIFEVILKTPLPLGLWADFLH